MLRNAWIVMLALGAGLAAPETTVAQDPADSLYRAARERLDRGEFAGAASLFRQIHQRHPQSIYTPDALYWESFARYRIGTDDELRAALATLEEQRRRHPSAATRGDAEALATRIRGALARLGDPDATAEVLAKAAGEPDAACSDADHEVRTAALNALLRMDSGRAVPILHGLLERRDACAAPLRKRAVFLLAQTQAPETEAMLLDVAMHDPDREIRKQAVVWLSQVTTESAVSALERIAATDSSELTELALLALSQHPSPRAERALREFAARTSAPNRLRERAIFWLGQKRSSENAAFLRELYGQLDDSRLKERTFFALSQLRGEETVRWLVAIARDTTEPTTLRKRALFWAGETGDAVGELVALYDRLPDRELKEYLIFVYTQSPAPEATDKLIEIARTERDVHLRKRAIFWLSQSNDPRAAQVLAEIIGQP